jgi:hypothetical protein
LPSSKGGYYSAVTVGVTNPWGVRGTRLDVWRWRTQFRKEFWARVDIKT